MTTGYLLPATRFSLPVTDHKIGLRNGANPLVGSL